MRSTRPILRMKGGGVHKEEDTGCITDSTGKWLHKTDTAYPTFYSLYMAESWSVGASKACLARTVTKAAVL
jgi:hypothetical protein